MSSAVEKDINDAFDEILFAEETVIKKAYQAGFNEGASQGNSEGYHLGYHRGAELGAELGFYTGVVEICLEQHEKAMLDRVKEQLKHLKVLLDNFPRVNDETVDIVTLADQIRTKYKKVCAQMKLNMPYPETNIISF
ncbi:unnamed protein product [Acanthoscelides obtectus]|uniref:Essential protein Yae1 N-terminal domain-containing protein n=1 Tax=Acanthoscelides obtectus TaxID=200917 RepID=A0A9P0K0H2_ACAOB|nr:unnamed protein product [Acanthoscelides obtectus]CAK1654002.1 Oral cancer-overexpressed protein 1 homolog [Acanthoscelides obtectus]